jgi:hypothetical protein
MCPLAFKLAAERSKELEARHGFNFTTEVVFPVLRNFVSCRNYDTKFDDGSGAPAFAIRNQIPPRNMVLVRLRHPEPDVERDVHDFERAVTPYLMMNDSSRKELARMRKDVQTGPAQDTNIIRRLSMAPVFPPSILLTENPVADEAREGQRLLRKLQLEQDQAALLSTEFDSEESKQARADMNQQVEDLRAGVDALKDRKSVAMGSDLVRRTLGADAFGGLATILTIISRQHWYQASTNWVGNLRAIFDISPKFAYAAVGVWREVQKSEPGEPRKVVVFGMQPLICG